MKLASAVDERIHRKRFSGELNHIHNLGQKYRM